MTGLEINNLIQVGATDLARKKLKRMGMTDRLKTLNDCVPYVNESPKSLKFFQENFSKELGAIMMAERDLEKAETLYRSASKY
jgi:hypothetical protein